MKRTWNPSNAARTRNADSAGYTLCRMATENRPAGLGDGEAEVRTGRPLLSVGYPLGMAVPIESGEPTDQPYELRYGSGYLQLAEVQYQLWLLALSGRKRSDLEVAAQEQGFSQADDVIAGLLRVEALVELEDDPVANAPLFERLRLIPTGIGMGNSVEEPTEFKIGLPGLGAVLAVDLRTYDVWGGSDGRKTIAEVCREAAEQVGGVSPDRFYGQVAVNLPVLLQEGVAYLDAL